MASTNNKNNSEINSIPHYSKESSPITSLFDSTLLVFIISSIVVLAAQNILFKTQSQARTILRDEEDKKYSSLEKSIEKLTSLAEILEKRLNTLDSDMKSYLLKQPLEQKLYDSRMEAVVKQLTINAELLDKITETVSKINIFLSKKHDDYV